MVSVEYRTSAAGNAGGVGAGLLFHVEGQPPGAAQEAREASLTRNVGITFLQVPGTFNF